MILENVKILRLKNTTIRIISTKGAILSLIIMHARCFCGNMIISRLPKRCKFCSRRYFIHNFSTAHNFRFVALRQQRSLLHRLLVQIRAILTLILRILWIFTKTKCIYCYYALVIFAVELITNVAAAAACEVQIATNIFR